MKTKSRIKGVKPLLKKGLKWFGVALGALAVLCAVWAMIYQEKALYLVQSAKGQSELFIKGRYVGQVMNDPNVDIKLKQNLKLVQDVKNFAESELKLRPTQNYTKYIDLGRDYLVMVMTASPPFEMVSKTWWFPVVGTVPYKGYFDKEEGQKAIEKLKAEGYETYYRASPAYSTLGWFNDPLLSTMMQYGEYYLINTVIHESVHATLWIPGEVTFNENMASFIGNKGTLSYLEKKYGKGSNQYKEALYKLDDQKVFAQFIGKVYDKLDKLYKSKAFEANKEEKKRALIAQMKKEYKDSLLKQIKGKGYAGFENKEWNNAMIMSFRHYNQDQDKFIQLFEKHNQDIPKFMTYLQENGKKVYQDFRKESKD